MRFLLMKMYTIQISLSNLLKKLKSYIVQQAETLSSYFVSSLYNPSLAKGSSPK